MVVLPTGTLTFLLTDLEGSTRAWESRTDAMRAAMARHDAIVSAAIERNRGAAVESGREGDSILAVFTRPRDAAACAIEIQRGFRDAAWPEDLVLRTRIALHTGEVQLRGGHYFGPPLNRCARVLALGHGGQILLTQATRELLRDDAPGDADLVDLGVHRLKDLRHGERVFQLVDRLHPDTFPPLHSRGAYRTNLPAALTSFVGRDRELADLRALLRKERLVTLAGPGGSGKTRLAKELALAAAGDLRDGAWFVDLAPLSDGALVARAAAAALDVDEQQGRDVVDTLVEHCAERELLLVLDNCEHLLDASASFTERLLTACPSVTVLATSREPLNVAGETVSRVEGLVLDDAARLFMERARARRRADDGRTLDADLVADICRRLDGIPLAIELAAARTATMPLGEIARRLALDLRLLSGGARTAARRQQTLEATIEWSHELLSEPERALFRRLAVFPGSFSLDAAETICASADLPREAILDHLGQLVAKSLVEQQDDRYVVLQTIRAYAEARLLGAAEESTLRDAHASYYLAVLATRRPGAFAAWLDTVALEHDNLRSALAWCVRSDPERGARIAAALYDFWLGRGHALEALRWLAQLEPLLPEGALRARLLLDAGVFAYTAGDFRTAPELVRSGLAMARRSGDATVVARGLVVEGGVALAAAKVDVAQPALDEALAIARQSGGGRLEVEVLHHLGALTSVRGDIRGARARFSESIDLRRRLGIADEANNTLTLRAFASLLLSDIASARADILEALRLALPLRDRRAAWSLDVLACVCALSGQGEDAMRLAGAARAIFEATAQRPPAMWGRLVDPSLERARAQLGETAAAAAFEAGRAMSFDQALHHGLSIGPAPAPSAPSLAG